MTIGERIAKCRKEKNLSQEYVAELLEVSRQAVSKWETGQSEPDTGNLIRLGQILGVSVEYLASGEEAPPKVVYVEKHLPTFRIIGFILLGLGGLCALLGVLAPLMIGIGLATAALGILLILLQKRGLLLGAIILALGTVLFLAQGFTGGIDGPTLLLIVLLSVGLPSLTYAVIALVRKLRAEKKSPEAERRKKLVKRIVVLGIAALLVITAIALALNAVLERRRNAFAKAAWFSADKLSAYLVEDLPAPTDTTVINIDGERILLHFDTDGYHAYLEHVYQFLLRCEFPYLGTRGRLLEEDENGLPVYEWLKQEKNVYYGPEDHHGFSRHGDVHNPDDYYFVYSNGETDGESGEQVWFVIYIDGLESNSTVSVNGKHYTYNFEMSIYRATGSEIYRIPTESEGGR